MVSLQFASYDDLFINRTPGGHGPKSLEEDQAMERTRDKIEAFVKTTVFQHQAVEKLSLQNRAIGHIQIDIKFTESGEVEVAEVQSDGRSGTFRAISPESPPESAEDVDEFNEKREAFVNAIDPPQEPTTPSNSQPPASNDSHSDGNTPPAASSSASYSAAGAAAICLEMLRRQHSPAESSHPTALMPYTGSLATFTRPAQTSKQALHILFQHSVNIAERENTTLSKTARFDISEADLRHNAQQLEQRLGQESGFDFENAPLNELIEHIRPVITQWCNEKGSDLTVNVTPSTQETPEALQAPLHRAIAPPLNLSRREIASPQPTPPLLSEPNFDLSTARRLQFNNALTPSLAFSYPNSSINYTPTSLPGISDTTEAPAGGAMPADETGSGALGLLAIGLNAVPFIRNAVRPLATTIRDTVQQIATRWNTPSYRDIDKAIRRVKIEEDKRNTEQSFYFERDDDVQSVDSDSDDGPELDEFHDARGESQLFLPRNTDTRMVPYSQGNNKGSYSDAPIGEGLLVSGKPNTTDTRMVPYSQGNSKGSYSDAPIGEGLLVSGKPNTTDTSKAPYSQGNNAPTLSQLIEFASEWLRTNPPPENRATRELLTQEPAQYQSKIDFRNAVIARLQEIDPRIFLRAPVDFTRGNREGIRASLREPARFLRLTPDTTEYNEANMQPEIPLVDEPKPDQNNPARMQANLELAHRAMGTLTSTPQAKQQNLLPQQNLQLLGAASRPLQGLRFQRALLRRFAKGR